MKIGVRANFYNWNMRRAREEKGLTQTKLGEMLGVRYSVIADIELLKARADLKYLKTLLEQIADVLEKPFDYLFPPDYLMALTENKLPKQTVIDIFFDRDIDKLPQRIVPLLENPVEIVEMDDLRSDIEKALLELPDRERMILEFRYGIYDGEEKTLEKTAVKFGVTREKIRQLEAQALSRLRNPRVSYPMKSYL